MSTLEQLNLKQLQEMARKLEIPNRSKLRKAELILALLQAQGGSPARSTGKTTQQKETLAASTGSTPSSSSGASQSSPVQAHFGPHGDPGLPLSESYGRDCVVLMVQDPQHLYAWWELTGGGIDRLRAQIGEDGSMVLLLEGPQGQEQRDIDFASGNYYLAVAPGAQYRVGLGLRDHSGTIHLLAESQTVETPTAGPSDRLDEEWMAVDETFSELLARAGVGDESLTSSERFRSERTWSQTPVHPLSSGHLFNLPSSFSLSSTALSSSALHQPHEK